MRRLTATFIVGAIVGFVIKYLVEPVETVEDEEEAPAMTLISITRDIDNRDIPKVVTALWYHNRDALEEMGVSVKEFYR